MVVHYDGCGFSGWQYQPKARTVQGELEATIRKLFGNKEIHRVVGAGRTDSGVHATGQVATVDAPVRWSAEALRCALNATLADGIWVESARVVRPDFHPRFDAISRTYSYRVGTTPAAASPFEKGRCWPLCRPLDSDALREGAELIVGTHSFKAFARAGQPERGYECAVSFAEWSCWRLGQCFEITANRFLHRMVRYLVGTMVAASLGQRPVLDIGQLLADPRGATTSPPAPPQGLFLKSVNYVN